MSETTPAPNGAPAVAPVAAPAAGLTANGTDPVLPGGETPDQALTRAQTALQAKRFNESAGICNDVLATLPDYPPALAVLGITHSQMQEPERAIALLSRAVQLRPGVGNWHAHLSSICRSVNRIEEARVQGEESVRLDGNNVDHLVNLALVYCDADLFDNAIACLLRSVGLKEDHADGRLALAQILLAQGDFAAGWHEYEWRNMTEAGKLTMPATTSAPWNGMRIPNGRLLLVGDQGYGDTIQFARYIEMARERVQEVVLGCSEEMGPLLRDMPGVDHFYSKWTDVPGHAAYCRLSSLPYVFQTKPDTIPNKVPYMKADPARIAAWRERLNSSLPAGKKRVGIAWTGRPTHPNDRRRSIGLRRLLPLGEIEGIAWVSLQKPMPAADKELLSHFPHMIDIADDLTDFGETAALMENLDLIVTIDTSMGHLAGALARPVWIMLAKAADFRWMLDRSDTPWYPTARLFRQKVAGGWDPVVEEVKAALAGEVGGSGS